MKDNQCIDIGITNTYRDGNYMRTVWKLALYHAKLAENVLLKWFFSVSSAMFNDRTNKEYLISFVNLKTNAVIVLFLIM